MKARAGLNLLACARAGYMIGKLENDSQKLARIMAALGWVALGFFSLFLVYLHGENLSLPIFWDEIVPYVSPALYLARGSLWNAIPGFYPSEDYLGHPPGFPLLLAILLRLGGEKIEILRGAMLLFSIGSLFLTYTIGKRLGGVIVGILSALALLASPGYLASAILVVPEIPTIFFCLLSAYLLLARKRLLYFVPVLCFAAFLRESALAFLLPLAGFYLYKNRRPVDLLAALLPLAILPLFALGEKIRSGSFSHFSPPVDDIYASFPEFFANVFRNLILLKVFLLQGASYLLLAGAIALIAAVWKRRKVDEATAFIFFVAAAFTLGIAVLNQANARYLLPMVPLLVVFSVAALVRGGRAWLASTALAIALIPFFNQYYLAPNSTEGGMVDVSFSYVEAVKRDQEVIGLIKKNFSQEKILADWPYLHMLREPFLGYVSEAMEADNSGSDRSILLRARSYSPGVQRKYASMIQSGGYKIVSRYELPHGGIVEILGLEKANSMKLD